MNAYFIGAYIHYQRMAKNWTLEGLCKGLCAVSYLSRIEQGKAEAAPELQRQLLARLDCPWHDEPDTLLQGSALLDAGYEAVFAGDEKAQIALGEKLQESWELFANSPLLLDCNVLRPWLLQDALPDNGFLKTFAPIMDARQKCLWLLLQHKEEEALAFLDCPLCYLSAGNAACFRGNYPVAIHYLQQGYHKAAEEGFVHLMLSCKTILGNCYLNLHEFTLCQLHYKVAERLAAILKDEATALTLRYNLAATALETGQDQEAYDVLRTLPKDSVTTLHKLAVACEKLGRKEEALEALAQAEHILGSNAVDRLFQQMCQLVRYRLECPGYLQENDYGERLTRLFRDLQETLPSGYAEFHLTWMLEWLRARRQYKQVSELLLEFPKYSRLSDA